MDCWSKWRKSMMILKNIGNGWMIGRNKKWTWRCEWMQKYYNWPQIIRRWKKHGQWDNYVRGMSKIEKEIWDITCYQKALINCQYKNKGLKTNTNLLVVGARDQELYNWRNVYTHCTIEKYGCRKGVLSTKNRGGI